MASHSYNVASHLVRMAATQPNDIAIVSPVGRVARGIRSPHREITFAGLNADSDAIAHGLTASGIARGTRTVLMVPPSPDFFALSFALFKIGAVPVLIDPGMGVKNLGKCLAEAAPSAFIGVAKAHLARRLFGWASQSVSTTINVGRVRFFCTASLGRLREIGKERGAFDIPHSTADEPAAILFTSGSTGPAKGTVYTHGIFSAQVELLKLTYGIQPGEVDLCTFPLFALFGPALGMTCVIPDMDASRPATIDPHKAASQMLRFGVTNLFGSPAVIRRLGELTDPAPMARLRRVISAGAPASAAAIERLGRLLPDGVEVFTPYGATEALPVANIGSREILHETRKLTEAGKGVCVGRPVAGIDVRVIAISDSPIEEWSESLLALPGEVGEFVVRGPIVTREYFNRPDAARLAKIRDPKTGEVLHRMGDVGYVDEDGRLWFCGRKSQRVVTPHGTLFTDMVEPIFNAIPGVARTALVGVSRKGVIYPVVCIEFDLHTKSAHWRSDTWVKTAKRFRERAREFEHTREISTFLPHTGFPMDVRHNSKIFREKLAAWADKQLGPRWSPDVQAEARANA